jgi:Secretory lipase
VTAARTRGLSSFVHRSFSQIFLQVLTVLCAAAWSTGSVELADSQAPPSPAKNSRALRTLPLTKFYDTPDPLLAGKPGELIRFEPFYEYNLSYEISAFRILYHSRSSSGEDVAVSGVVLFPHASPPAGGWPVIAWAHDFTGSARQCAPSLLRNLNAGPLLSMYVGLGYAVVASDYAGLGTNFPHAALDMRSNALDVIYSLQAARVAFPHLGDKWLAAGYSQGSLVAVGVAEAASENGDPHFLGAIAISGLGEPREIFERLAKSPSYAMPVFLAKGIKTLFPAFQSEDMLTEKAAPLIQYVSHACDASLGPKLAPAELLKPGWENNRYVKEFFTRNTLGQKHVSSPLLVLSGDVDSDVPSSLTASTVAQLCRQNNRVLFVKYPGHNASAVIGDSVSEQVSWIRARFAALPVPSNCP